MVNVATPEAFKKLCRNLGPDIMDFVSSEDEFVAHALIGIDGDDAKVLITFLQEKLKHDSPIELKNWMWSMPGTVSFNDEQALVRFLRELLAKLQRIE